MNKLEIIDFMKQRYFAYNYLDQAALDYIAGDDASFGKINKYPWTYSMKYEEKIVSELDGENAEAAARCLRAIAAMRREGIVSSREEIEILSRCGVSLEYILSNCTFFGGYLDVNDFKNYATWFMEFYSDEAAKIVTPVFLDRPISDEKHKRTKAISYFIAAELIARGEGKKKSISGLFTKSLYDCVLDYATRNGSVGMCLLAGIYKTDKRFEEYLLKNLSYSSATAHILKMSKAYSHEEIRDLLFDLELHDVYTFSAVSNIFGDKIRLAEAEKVAADEEHLLPLMINMAYQTKWIPEIYYVCEALLIALKDGRGQECLAKFERTFIHICKRFSESIDIPASRFYHSVIQNSEKAISSFKLTEKTVETSWRPMGLSVLIKLYDYSKIAHDIINTLLLTADRMNDHKGWHRFSEMQKCFCCVRAESFGISVYDSLNILLRKGVSVKSNLYGILYSGIDFCPSDWKKIFSGAGMEKFVSEHINEAIAFYDEIKDTPAQAAYWAELLCTKAGCKDVDFLLKLLYNKSKVVSRLASQEIYENEDAVRPSLEEILPSLKADKKRKAQALIKKWDNDKKYGADFAFTSNELAEEFISDNYDKSLEKKISFIPDSCFEGVRYADFSGNVPADMIKYIFMEYMNLDSPYKLAVCSKLAERMFAPDFSNCIENIYQSWLENGADNKTKMIMVPYCIFASDTQILALKKQLIAWAEASRGALGAFVINAIALNGGSTALMMVNDISAKFPNNQVKSAAKCAFSFAAEALGVPIDVLADKIVPDLGLNKNGEKVIDYGSRTFTLSLMPDFTLSIYDNSKGKEVKSLPKPNADDDAAKAETAKKYLSDLKKQLKAVTASQKTRLEDVFRNGRTWNTSDWNALFVENPVMHRFARNLIWGIYENKKLISTFRYTDDGTFCDMNDDEFELPENAEISLVHPIELTDDAIEAWAEQLADYEIIQPFAQISANIIKLTDEDINEKGCVSKYSDRKFVTGSMTGAAKKYSLVRSSIEDGGGFSGYHIQDRVLGIGMAMNGENMYVGQSYDESVILENVYFYRLPEGETIPDSYNDYDSINPLELNGRFVSCCLNILEGILE